MKEENSVLGLSTIRRNRGISLEQIAESTKISIRSLEAIEQGNFRKLPGGIYNTSYIRQYARAIEYDECALIAFYKREMASSDAAGSNGTNGDGGYGGFRPHLEHPGLIALPAMGSRLRQEATRVFRDFQPTNGLRAASNLQPCLPP